MFQTKATAILSPLTVFLVLAFFAPSAWAQQGSQGTVSVTVTDPSGSSIPGAQVELRDLSTNDVRTAATQESGAHNFTGLSIGTYSLTVTRPGFSKQVVNSVVVQAAQVTDVNVKLQIGSTAQTVEVSGGASPVVETTSNAIGTTIDVKQIEDLPIQGRDLTQLAQLTPGYTGTPGQGANSGTWNGLPSIAQGSNIDGVIGSSSRMKFSGNAQPIVSPRLEDIEEMTVQTDQLDLNQGFGQANMQINFVTRRGTNAFHGRLFEDFQNSALNANSWYNNAAGLARPRLNLNDFGGSLGGRVIKDKLFFFGSFSMSKQPGSINATNLVLTPAAQSGLFTYTGTDGAVHNINVLSTANSFNSALPGTVNPAIAAELQAINASTQSGSVTPGTDPNISTLSWLQRSPTTFYYPTFRIDYNASEKLRVYFAFNETKESQPSVTAAFLPGSSFNNEIAGNRNNNYTASLGIDYTISPTLLNSFKGGFLYNATWYAYNVAPLYAASGVGAVNWNLPVPYPYGGNMSGQQFNTPVSTYYPVFNASDNLTWQHDKHTLMGGFSWYREQDHYWNPPVGYPNSNLGLANGDPALDAFSNSGGSATVPNATSAQLAEAEQLYAVLTGRVSSVAGTYPYDPKTGQYKQSVGAYNLDELQSAWGIFFQDSWRIKPNLTLNYGLRWDFTGDDHDLTGAYHGASPSAIYGPSGVGDLFAPGTLNGNLTPNLVASAHQYNGWNVSPQPAVGIAWNPQKTDGWLAKLTGGGKTVIRAGYSLRRYTEPEQYFWNNASDYGSFFYQNFYLNANTTGTPGTFAPGSLSLGQAFPAYGYAPTAYQNVAPESDYTFLNSVGVNGINPYIKQPYTQSWNFGIQRALGDSAALEIRYNGNYSGHQWLSENINEVNVFENGFLTQFKAAQQNLAINQAHGVSSFSNNGYAGQQQTPVFNAAFAGETPGGSGVPLADFGNTSFINMLNTGQVGALASALSGISGPVPYVCNLVGSGFKPCATNAGFTGAGAGYPINFFQANPYAAGTSVGYMDSVGYSNYNGLQVDFREKQWHGLQFDANYTWSHSLGISTPNSWTSSFPQYTLRDLRLSYGPTLFDIRHVVHANVTADLPFGKGRQFLNRGGVVNAVLGGWTVGNIFTIQTGEPWQYSGGGSPFLLGGNATYNDYADGGVILNGVTRAQLQNSVGVYRVSAAENGGSSATFVDLINPKYLVSAGGGGANSAYITPNTTPGTIGTRLFLYGPHEIFDDMSVTKRIPITERMRFVMQAEFLNVFNHAVFAPNSSVASSPYSASVQGFGFGTGTVANTPRVIELRANFEF